MAKLHRIRLFQIKKRGTTSIKHAKTAENPVKMLPDQQRLINPRVKPKRAVSPVQAQNQHQCIT